MFKRPDTGYRTYTTANRCLLVGAALAAFGIYKGVDLASLGFLIVGVTTPILGGQAWKSVYTTKFSGAAKPTP